MKKEIKLGIDIGGTKTAFGFVTEEGQLLASQTIPTLGSQPASDFFSRLYPAVESLQATLPPTYTLTGIGVGAPNANFFTGIIENPPNLQWGHVPICDIFAAHFRIPCILTNDAKAAAIGEMHFGGAKGLQNFLLITIGTGLGSGIVANGELLYGHDGFAGEIGHTIYERDGRQCGCSRKGCLEAYVSGPGVKRTAFYYMENFQQASVLHDYTYENLNGKQIHQEACKGDPLSIQVLEETGRILGRQLADSVAYLSPEAIFICGGLSQAGEFFFGPLRTELESSLLSVFRGKIKILPSSLPHGQSAILGAAALSFRTATGTAASIFGS